MARKSRRTTFKTKSAARRAAKRKPGSQKLYKVKGGWRLGRTRRRR